MSFFTPALVDGLSLESEDSKSPQVSRILLSILADLNNAVVWMVSFHLQISSFYSPLGKHLGIVPRAPITTGITVTFMVHSFFLVLSQDLSICFFFALFDFYSMACRDSKIHYSTGSLFFLLIITRSGFLAGIRESVCTWKSKRILCLISQDGF